MVAHKKSLFLLKISSDETARNFKTIAGLEAVNFNLNNQVINQSNLATGEWRVLLETSGVKSVSILANGIFKNSEDHELVRQIAMSGEAKKFELEFNNGDSLIGDFVINNYQRRGQIDSEEFYSFALNSNGLVEYNKAH